MEEIMGHYLGRWQGAAMLLALFAAIALRRRIRKRHLGWLVAATAVAMVAFFGLLLASFRAGDLMSGLIHAALLPALAAVSTGCAAVAGFTLMLALFGLSLSDER